MNEIEIIRRRFVCLREALKFNKLDVNQQQHTHIHTNSHIAPINDDTYFFYIKINAFDSQKLLEHLKL